MRSKVRAYSHQGHGPRRSTGRIHISDFRPHHLTCERQPVHTFGAAGRQLFDFAHIEANADGALLSASRIKGSVDALVLRDNDALGLGLRLAAHGPATWG